MARLKARVQGGVHPKGVSGGRSVRFLAFPASVAALAFAVYVPTLSAGWTNTDDIELITEDLSFLASDGAVGASFGRPFFPQANRRAYYRPLVTASLVLDTPRGEAPSAAAYHLTNVVLHVVSTVLVFALARTFVSIPAIAASAAALFAVHPMTVQTVAWIPGRCDGLLAVFALGAFIAWMRFDATNSRAALAAHHVLFAAALFSKEAAVAIPIVSLAYSLLVSKRTAPVRSPFTWLGWLVLVTVWFLARKSAVGAIGSASAGTLIRNTPALAVGFGKMLLPVEFDVLATLRDSSLVPGVIALAALTLVAVTVPRDRRRLFLWASVLFPLLLLVPALGVSDFLILDNRLYLPLAGVCIGAGVAAEPWLQKAQRPRAYGVAALAAVAGLAGWTISRASVFESPRAFCEAAVAGSPHLGVAYLNLGAVEYRDGRADEARRHFERAIELDPTQTVAHNDLGLIYMNSGELARAETEFKTELAANPNYSKAHFNLGLIYARTGRADMARDHFEMVVALMPSDADAWGELLKYWAPRDGQRAEAIMKRMESLGVQFYSPQGE